MTSDVAPEQGRKACTVTQAMNVAKRGLEQIRITVVGEVSEFNDKAGYKAAYFTIRDDDCAMPCLMWRDAYNASGVRLRQGMLVQVTGFFTCYPAKGRMQFQVRKLEMAGEGDLRVRVAQIAQRLEAEGLMDPARKRRHPALPKRIAVITSPRGKAIDDVRRTLKRRYPLGELLVFGVAVEGEQAPRNMCEALSAAQATVPAPDVILLVRGGGSYEDLMPFNDEGLARAISACTIPVVTGIGHEPDNSIADMVADRRCSTPTAAAEAVALSVDELRGKLTNADRMLNAAYVSCLGSFSHKLDRLAQRPVWSDSHFLTAGGYQALDVLQGRLARALPEALRSDGATLDMLGQRLKSAIPKNLVANERSLDLLQERLRLTAPTLTEGFERSLAVAAARLDALSPLKTLSRGYSIAFGPDGTSVVSKTSQVKPGDKIAVRVEDGALDCTVDGLRKNA